MCEVLFGFKQILWWNDFIIILFQGTLNPVPFTASQECICVYTRVSACVYDAETTRATSSQDP